MSELKYNVFVNKCQETDHLIMFLADDFWLYCFHHPSKLLRIRCAQLLTELEMQAPVDVTSWLFYFLSVKDIASQNQLRWSNMNKPLSFCIFKGKKMCESDLPLWSSWISAWVKSQKASWTLSHNSQLSRCETMCVFLFPRGSCNPLSHP